MNYPVPEIFELPKSAPYIAVPGYDIELGVDTNDSYGKIHKDIAALRSMFESYEFKIDQRYRTIEDQRIIFHSPVSSRMSPHLFMQLHEISHIHYQLHCKPQPLWKRIRNKIKSFFKNTFQKRRKKITVIIK